MRILFAALCLVGFAIPYAHADFRIEENAKAQLLVNLHPDARKARLYSANFQQDGLIPICSEVQFTDVDDNSIKFTVLATGTEYTYIHHRAGGQYFELHLEQIFGTKCNQAALDNLSATDKTGVKLGKALPGMTKAGVVFALGSPPVLYTPNQDNNEWIYYRNRFVKNYYYFDEQGLFTRATGIH